MADRGNHYERAFEDYLRSLRLTCISVDESRRAFAAEETLKSLDFIVLAPNRRMLLIDVKGRKLAKPGGSLENWMTEDDLHSLARWQAIFNQQALALLAFVYLLPSAEEKLRFTDHFTFADRHYGCLTITLAECQEHGRVRSPKWKTVSIPRRAFATFARPFTSYLATPGAADRRPN